MGQKMSVVMHLLLGLLLKVNTRDWPLIWLVALARKEMDGGVVPSVWRRWIQISGDMHLVAVSCVNHALM
jgi:hypothetical protein